MRFSIRQYAEALLELEGEIEAGQASAVAHNFIQRLSRAREGAKLPQIVREAERLLSERKNVMAVDILTACEADADMQKTLRTKAEQLFPGKKIETKFLVDSSLIGGAQFRSDELLYDASIAASVRSLKSILTK